MDNRKNITLEELMADTDTRTDEEVSAALRECVKNAKPFEEDDFFKQ